jgi:hypothetical protein
MRSPLKKKVVVFIYLFYNLFLLRIRLGLLLLLGLCLLLLLGLGLLSLQVFFSSSINRLSYYLKPNPLNYYQIREFSLKYSAEFYLSFCLWACFYFFG